VTPSLAPILVACSTFALSGLGEPVLALVSAVVCNTINFIESFAMSFNTWPSVHDLVEQSVATR
jgi:hypothetical protein